MFDVVKGHDVVANMSTVGTLFGPIGERLGATPASVDMRFDDNSTQASKAVLVARGSIASCGKWQASLLRPTSRELKLWVLGTIIESTHCR
jgi:hypothetical protein